MALRRPGSRARCLSRSLGLFALAACAPVPRSDVAADVLARSGGPSAARVYVVNTGDGTVSLVDLEKLREVARYPVGDSPYGIALNRDNSVAAVGVEGEGRVKFYALPAFELLGETEIGPMHHDHMLLTSDGNNVVVANYESDSVIGIDVRTRREAFRVAGISGPHAAKIGPRSKHLYVTCKKVTGVAAVDTVAAKLVRFYPLKVNPRGLSFFPDEERIYFGSFWVDGFFALDANSGEIDRMFAFDAPPADNEPREVTYHGVETIGDDLLLAANEGRSFVDLVDAGSGALLDRLTGTANPCCLAAIPGTVPTRLLVSNIGDDSVQVVEVTSAKRLVSIGKVSVGADPKRVAFVR